MPFKKIVISTWLKKVLLEKYQQKAELLITPVNEKIFYRKTVRQSEAFRVCFLHHDYDWKGYKDIIEAIKIIRSKNLKIYPVVFGEKLQDPSPLFEDAGLNLNIIIALQGKHYVPFMPLVIFIYVQVGMKVWECLLWRLCMWCCISNN